MDGQFIAGCMDFNTASGRGAAYAFLVIGRFIVGLGSGAATVIVPMFLTELASKQHRGMFGALNQMTLVVAILIAQVWTHFVLTGERAHTRSVSPPPPSLTPVAGIRNSQNDVVDVIVDDVVGGVGLWPGVVDVDGLEVAVGPDCHHRRHAAVQWAAAGGVTQVRRHTLCSYVVK